MTDITKSIAVPTDRFDIFNRMAINCGRTIKRFIRTLTTLAKKPNESIAAASTDAAEAKAIYRWLDNEKLTEEVVMTTYRKDRYPEPDSGER